MKEIILRPKKKDERTFHLRIKSEDTKKRRISGFASTRFKDRAGDVVRPEALSKSMDQYMQNPVVLLNHDPTKAIGKTVDFKVTNDGLFVVDEIGKGFRDADEAWTKIEQGILKALSIGFIPLETDIIEGAMVITELELVEHSVVAIPSNREALFSVEKALARGTDLIKVEKEDEAYKSLKEIYRQLELIRRRYEFLPIRYKILVDDCYRQFRLLDQIDEKQALEREIIRLQDKLQIKV